MRRVLNENPQASDYGVDPNDARWIALVTLSGVDITHRETIGALVLAKKLGLRDGDIRPDYVGERHGKPHWRLVFMKRK